MTGPAGGRPGRAERWRKPVIVAASVIAHAGIFALIGLRGGFDLPSPAPATPILYLEIEPRPLLPGERPRVRPAPAPVLPTPPVAAGAPAAPPDQPFRDPAEEDDRPAPPAPRLSVPAPGVPAPPAGTGAWAVRPQSLGDRVGRGLRTSPLGCASPETLSMAERAVCDTRFGQRAASAPLVDNPGDSRFAAEGARRLAEYEARRRPLSGGVGVVGPQDGPGSNFGMGVAGAHLDQSLRPESTRNIRTRRDGRPSSGNPLTPGSGFSREPD